MANVIHLAEGENPPKNESCLVVLRDVAGGYFVLSSADSYQREIEPTTYPVSDAHRTVAIERAKAHANSHDIANIYVDPH